jgi:hypothetical protein
MGEFVTLNRFGSERLLRPSRARHGGGLLASTATDPVSHRRPLSRRHPATQASLLSPDITLPALLAGLTYSDQFAAIRLCSVCSASPLGEFMGWDSGAGERWKIGCP